MKRLTKKDKQIIMDVIADFLERYSECPLDCKNQLNDVLNKLFFEGYNREWLS